MVTILSRQLTERCRALPRHLEQLDQFLGAKVAAIVAPVGVWIAAAKMAQWALRGAAIAIHPIEEAFQRGQVVVAGSNARRSLRPADDGQGGFPRVPTRRATAYGR